MVGKLFGAPLYVNSKAQYGNPFYIPAWGVKVFSKRTPKDQNAAAGNGVATGTGSGEDVVATDAAEGTQAEVKNTGEDSDRDESKEQKEEGEVEPREPEPAPKRARKGGGRGGGKKGVAKAAVDENKPKDPKRLRKRNPPCRFTAGPSRSIASRRRLLMASRASPTPSR